MEKEERRVHPPHELETPVEGSAKGSGKPAQPKVADLINTEPEVAEPDVVDPVETEPKPAQPKIADLVKAEPEAAEPAAAEPVETELAEAELEVAEAAPVKCNAVIARPGARAVSGSGGVVGTPQCRRR